MPSSSGRSPDTTEVHAFAVDQLSKCESQPSEDRPSPTTECSERSDMESLGAEDSTDVLSNEGMPKSNGVVPAFLEKRRTTTSDEPKFNFISSNESTATSTPKGKAASTFVANDGSAAINGRPNPSDSGSGGKSRLSNSSSKPGNKKSFVWNYFKHPEGESGSIDRTRTQCLVCKSQLAFNASGTTTTMLNHLKSRHGDIAQREEQQRARISSANAAGGGGGSGAMNGRRKNGSETCRMSYSRPNQPNSLFGSHFRPSRGMGVKQEEKSPIAFPHNFGKDELPNFPPFGMLPSDLQSTKDMMRPHFLKDTNELGAGVQRRIGSPGRESISGGCGGPNHSSPQSGHVNRSNFSGIQFGDLSALTNSLDLHHSNPPECGHRADARSPTEGLRLGEPNVSAPLQSRPSPLLPSNPLTSFPMSSLPMPLVDAGLMLSSPHFQGLLPGLNSPLSGMIPNSQVNCYPPPSCPIRQSEPTESGRPVTNDCSPPTSFPEPFLPPLPVMAPPPPGSLANTTDLNGFSAARAWLSSFASLGFLPPELGTTGLGGGPFGVDKNTSSTKEEDEKQHQHQQRALISTPEKPPKWTDVEQALEFLTQTRATGEARTNAPPKMPLPPGMMAGLMHMPPAELLAPFANIPTANRPLMLQFLSRLQACFGDAAAGLFGGSVPPPPTVAARGGPNLCAETPTAVEPVAHMAGVGGFPWSGKTPDQQVDAAAGLRLILGQSALQTGEEQQVRQHHPAVSTSKTANSGDGSSGRKAQFPPETCSLSQATTVTDSAKTAAAAATKRKRGRPVYISPDHDATKRSAREQHTGRVANDGTTPMDAEAAVPVTAPDCLRGPGLGFSDRDNDDPKPEDLTTANNSYRNDSANAEKSKLGFDQTDSSPSGSWANTATRSYLVSALEEKLAYFLVRDLNPPELLDGEGFKVLLRHLIGGQGADENWTISSTRMRQEILPRLAAKTRSKNSPTRLAEKVKRDHGVASVHETSGRPPCDSPCNEPDLSTLKAGGILPSDTSTALAVEFWSTDGLGKQGQKCRAAKYATALVSSAQGPRFHVRNQILRTVNLHRQSALSEVVKECFPEGTFEQPTTAPPPPPTDDTETPVNSCLPGSASATGPRIPVNGPSPNNDRSLPHQDQILPRTLVTNDSAELTRHLRSLDAKESESFVVIPCLVSALSDAVSRGLVVPQVAGLIRDCEHLLADRAKSGTEPAVTLRSAEDEGAVVRLGWRTAFEVLQKSNVPSSGPSLDEKRLDLAKRLLSVIENLNQTLEFIHQKNVILTASMIWPILLNLRETYLSTGTDEGTPAAETVREFKRAVSQRLEEIFPPEGDVYETLQICSLIDPRFKARLQEEGSGPVKLLKAKVELLHKIYKEEEKSRTVEEGAQGGSEDACSASPSFCEKTDSAGLEKVFGMQFFTRTSLSEVDRYLREDSIGLQENPFTWWANKAARYPRLALLARHYLSIPLASFHMARLLHGGQAVTGGESDALCLPGFYDNFHWRCSCLSPEDVDLYTFLWHNWAISCEP
nr:unnamed protein product [Spirometra erinaceieuropaei]